MSEVTLHCGDCLPVMREMKDHSVDIVTDPPYGIADVWKGGASCGWAVARLATAQRNEWDTKPGKAIFDEILRVGKTIAIWGGNYFASYLPDTRGWQVWNKPERNFSLAEAELAWTNLDKPIRVCDYRRSDPDREHPTQKPLGVMKWSLEDAKIPISTTVFDPFMGSGTTGVACVQTGRNFIGCEIDPGYFAIARRRIAQAQAQPRLLP